MLWRVTQRNSRFGQEAEESGENIGKAELASLNNFSELWGIEAVPSCLVPSPGVIRAEG